MIKYDRYSLVARRSNKESYPTLLVNSVPLSDGASLITTYDNSLLYCGN